MSYDVTPRKGIVADPELPEFQTDTYRQRAGEIIADFHNGINLARESGELNGTTDQFIDVLKHQVYNPAAGDINISRSALGFMMHATTDPSLLALLNECRDERSKLGEPLRAKPEVMMAIVHGINYIKVIIEGKEDYIVHDGLDSPEKWSEVYQEIATEPAYRELYKRILLERDIVTTDPARAIGPHAVIRMVYGDRPVNVAEMGCGSKFLLKRMSSPDAADYDAYPSVDQTELEGEIGIVQKAAQKPINLIIGAGVDKTNPIATKANREWFMACGHPKKINPDALQRKRERIDFYNHIARNVIFIQQDMRSPVLEKGFWNVVYAATSAYQIPRGQRTEMFGKWQKLLTEDGLLIVQDNCRIDENGDLDFVDYGDHPYALMVKGKLTGNKWMEVARYTDSLCSEIINGKDMHEFMLRASPLGVNGNGIH